MKRIAVFASGEGTNAERIIKYFQESGRNATVALVVSSRETAPVVDRAQRLGVVCVTPPAEVLADGPEMIRLLAGHAIDAVVLAGYLKMVPAELIRAYQGQIVNIHPALLPKFGGKGMYGMRVHEAVVAAGERESGITIHHVNEQYDEGAIIFQASTPVSPDDSAADVAKKVQALEMEHYPRIIEQVICQ